MSKAIILNSLDKDYVNDVLNKYLLPQILAMTKKSALENNGVYIKDTKWGNWDIAFHGTLPIKAVKYDKERLYKTGEMMRDHILMFMRKETDTIPPKNNNYTNHGLKFFNKDDILIKVDEKGGRVFIEFRDDALFRQSLVPSKYSGINDIVALFVHGYTASKRVRGRYYSRTVPSSDSSRWRGPIRSLLRREPNRFMEHAVNDLAKTFSIDPRVQIKLNDKYKV